VLITKSQLAVFSNFQYFETDFELCSHFGCIEKETVSTLQPLSSSNDNEEWGPPTDIKFMQVPVLPLRLQEL
jgi:hypothetical protein